MYQQNMWVMYYLYPSFTFFPTPQMNYHYKAQFRQVELEKSNQQTKIPKAFVQPQLKNQNIKTKTKIKTKKQQVQSQDQSYSIPIKQDYKALQQKLGRNSSSNILRLFVKLLKMQLIRQRFQKIKQKFGFLITFKQFNSWLSGIGLKGNKYIRIKKVLKGARSKPQNGKVLAILYGVFESELCRSAILTSSKTQAKNILPTLAQVRNIKRQISFSVVQGYKQLKIQKK